MEQRGVTGEPEHAGRGEYAMALNCTITKAIEKTIPVSTIIPEATAERYA